MNKHKVVFMKGNVKYVAIITGFACRATVESHFISTRKVGRSAILSITPVK